MMADSWFKLLRLLPLCAWLVVLGVLPHMTFACDGQNQTTVAYDGDSESVVGYDTVSMLATDEKENGATGDCPPFAKFAELLAAKAGSTPLWRAVQPGELADIQAQNVFRNLGQAEGKYFSTTAEGAASYAKQAIYGFKDPPYTLIKTEVSSSFINRFGVDIMDRNVPGIVIPNNALPGLKPQVVDYFPLPPP